MFSVIIPLYNKAAYVEKALLSVLSQTYQEFELIVVNDGSTDDGFINLQFKMRNLEFEQPEQFKKVKIIDQPNQGVSAARNNGVHSANFDYIAFLDADDWWESTYLQEMKTLIEAYPESGIYGCSYYIVKNGRKHIAPIVLKPDFKAGIINYFRVYANTLCMPLWTGATIIKKEIFESEKGFKLNLKLGEDFDLWVRVASHYPVAFLNKPLAYYNQDVEMATRAIGFKLYEPEEHMLFTDYAKLMKNPDFRLLFERLAVYSLLPYYLADKNIHQVNQILSCIHWKYHGIKYFLFYKIFPKSFVQTWVNLNITGSSLKKVILKNF